LCAQLPKNHLKMILSFNKQFFPDFFGINYYLSIFPDTPKSSRLKKLDVSQIRKKPTKIFCSKSFSVPFK